jgi:uncharacterized protein YvpB
MKPFQILIIAGCIWGSVAIASDNSLSGRNIQIQYEDGQSYSVSFSDAEVTWKGLRGPDLGTERDAYRIKDMGPKNFLVSWTERDGSFVALVLDFEKMQAYSTGQAAGESWIRNGKITETFSAFTPEPIPSSVPNSVGIISQGQFTPPTSVARQSAWLPVAQIRQETNLCVPTSASMVLDYYGYTYSPREIKVWSRGQEFEPGQAFNDFTITYFSDLISGMRVHQIAWTAASFSNDDSGFENGIREIEKQIDEGKPVLVDTSLYTGHTFVVDGYDLAKDVLIIADPFIDAPGIREISLEDFSVLWNSTKVGSNIRAAIFTASP